MATSNQQNDVMFEDTEKNELITIDSISKSSYTKRPNRSPDDLNSPSSNHLAKKANHDIDPVLILAGDTPFDRTNFIEFDSKIIELTKADVKFTKLDKNGNLLIFLHSRTDVEKIMNSNSLFAGRKKIDLNLKDKRPKLVIKGLKFELAILYAQELKKEGIVDLINLSKNDYSPNIVKVIMNSEEAAMRLEKIGSIQIKQLKFEVAKELIKNKISPPKMTNQFLLKNNPSVAQSSTSNKEDDETVTMSKSVWKINK